MVEALVHRNELREAQVTTKKMTNARVPVIHLHIAATKSRKKIKASIYSSYSFFPFFLFMNTFKMRF